MDDYDPACPTEDDIQFELDLSQVPLPPSFPTEDKGIGRDSTSITTAQPSEPGREDSQKGKKRKKKRRRHEETRSQDEDDKEDCGAEKQTLSLQVPGQSSHRDGAITSLVEPTTESENVSDVDFVTKNPSSTTLTPLVNQDSVVTSTASATSTTLPSKPKMHFKLTQDPSGGKAKVSFQLKKSLKSAFHANEEKREEDDDVVENEGNDIVEKTAAGEYIPTRFKVSKKHEMFRPSLVEPSITVVFNSSLISAGATSNSNIITAQSVDTNLSPASVVKSQDSDILLDIAASAETTAGYSSRKDRSTRFGKDTKSSRKDEEEEKGKDGVDSPRELRRSERKDKKNENSNAGKDDSSRSTRRSSRGNDRDNERYDNSRSSYSRRDRDEDRQKEKEDKNKKAEVSESDDRRRSARFRKSDDVKGEGKGNSDKRQEDKNDSSSSHRKSQKFEHNPSLISTRGRRTRSSHRSKSISPERDDTTLLPNEDSDKLIILEQSADLKTSLNTDAASINDALSNNARMNSNIEVTPEVSKTEKHALQNTNTESVVEINDVSSEETAEKHPQIQKIVIRRSVDSNDFEIAKSDQFVHSELCSVNENVIVSCEQVMEKEDSLLSVSDREKVDASEKENSTREVVNTSEKENSTREVVNTSEKENSTRGVVTTSEKVISTKEANTSENVISTTEAIKTSENEISTTEAVNTSENEISTVARGDKKSVCDGEMTDKLEKVSSGHSIEVESRLNDDNMVGVLEKQNSGFSIEDESILNDDLEKEKCGLSVKDEKGVDVVQKEQSGFSVVEKSLDHILDTEKIGISQDSEKKLSDKVVDVLEEEKSGIDPKMDRSVLPDIKVGVFEKEKSGNSWVEEKSGMSKMDKTVLSDIKVDLSEKEKSGNSSVEEKSGISEMDRSMLSDIKVDVFEKEKSGNSSVEEKSEISEMDRSMLSDIKVDVFEKEKSGNSRVEEKSETSKMDKTVLSDIKVDVFEKGKSGNSSVEAKSDISKVDRIMLSDIKVDVFEKGKSGNSSVEAKSDISKADRKMLSDIKVVAFEKEKSDNSRVEEKSGISKMDKTVLSDIKVDVFEKEKSGNSRVEEKRLYDKRVDSLEKERPGHSRLKEKRMSENLFEKGKSDHSRTHETRYADKTVDEYEKGKSDHSRTHETRYADKTVDEYEKGKTGTSRVHDKQLIDKTDTYKDDSHTSEEDERKIYDDYERSKGKFTRENERRRSDKSDVVYYEKGKSRGARDDKRFSGKETVRSFVQQTYTKVRDRHRSSSSEDEFDRRLTSAKRTGAEKLLGRSSNTHTSPPYPEQVLVDVSALPGKSKWEMDDEDEALEETTPRREDTLFGKDLKSLDIVSSQNWLYRSQSENIQKFSHRMHRKTENSSNEEEKSHEHLKHRESKRDKAERKTKKKRKEDDNAHFSKISEESEEHKRGSPQSRAVVDNSKIVSYLREYSSKEDKALKARSEIDNSKLVTYLKEYSGKMTRELLHESSLVELDIPIEAGTVNKKKKAKEESTQSDSTKAAEDLDHQKAALLHADGLSDKKKEQPNHADSKVSYSESSKIIKGETDDKVEQHEVKEKLQYEASPSRSSPSSSHDRRQKVKSPEKILKEQDERFSLKEKKARSPSVDAVERAASKTSQRSRDKRDRSGSADKIRRNRRNRSRSAERQDHSRSVERKRGRRRSKSRSPSWRSRDRRNRSRSVSQDKRNDRRNRSRSASQDKRNDRRNRSRSVSQDKRNDRRNRSRSASQDKRNDRRNRSRSASQDKRNDRRNRSRSASQDKRNDRRNRSRSASQDKRNDRRNRSRSVSQDKRNDRRNRSRSASQDKRNDRRNRSRSTSQDKRSDRREKSRSRSRDRTYSYRSFRSPVRDSFGRNRRERRGRSRSNSFERSNDIRRRDVEDSHSRHSRRYNKSKSPDKKRSETSPLAGERNSKGSSNSDKIFKIKMEPESSLDLSSIPIPDEIPLPNEDMQTNIPDKMEQPQSPINLDSETVLKGEPMDCTDDVKDTITKESKVNNTKDNAEETAENISVLNVPKVEIATIAEQKIKNINPATLSSGKERQIKFSISRGGRKLKPADVSDILDDGDDAKDSTLKNMQPSSAVVDTAGSEGDEGAPPVHKIIKKIEEDIEDKEETNNTEEHLLNTKVEKLSETTNEINDPQISVNNQIEAEKINFPHKVEPENEKETAKSPQPQRLKFKYTPLWELEKDEIKPVVEEISKKVEGPYGLALDYGSESSDSADEDFNINKKEPEKVQDDSSPAEQKDAENLLAVEDISDDIVEDKVSGRKDLTQDLTTESNQPLQDLTAESNQPLQDLTAESNQPLKIEVVSVKTDASCERAQVLSEVKEECAPPEAIELPSLGNASSSVPSEVGEAYSPSHPSMEDADDLFDITASSVPTVRNESASKIEDKSTSKLVGKVAVSSVSFSKTAESHELIVVSSISPIVGTLNITTALSHQPSVIPQTTKMLLKASNTAVSPIPIVPSLVGQSFIGLHVPFAQSSLHAPTLQVPQPVPPPSSLPGTQLSNISFPPSTEGPKPVPPPSQISSSLPQTTLSFGGATLSSSLTTVPLTSAWDTPTFPLKTQSSYPIVTLSQGMTSQVLGVQGAFGFQGTTGSGLREIPTPCSLLETPVGAVLPCPTLPSLGTLQGSTLSVISQSTPSSFATIGGPMSCTQQKETGVDSSLNDVPPFKFRISRFHQGPPSTQAIPPPAVAIPPPSLTLPTTLGAPTAALVSNPVLVPSIPMMPSSQQHTSSALPKPVDSKQATGPTLSFKKTPPVARDQPASTTTHSKRPKISSILSQPKIEDLAILEVISAVDVKLKPVSTTLEGPNSDKSKTQSDHNIEFPSSNPALSSPSEKCWPEITSNIAAQETKSEATKLFDDTLHENNRSSEAVATEGDAKSSDFKENCSAELTRKSQSPSEDLKSSVVDSSNSLEGSILEPVSSSIHPLKIDMEDIPLPGEALSVPESQVSSSSFPPPGKTDPHLPPSSPPKPLPPAPASEDTSAVPELPSPKGQTLGSLLAERKKRFSQSPLAIGMLPKVQITQSPLAAGPLPKFLPEPEVIKNTTIPPKKAAPSPAGTDSKPILQLNLTSKQKKPLAEKEEPKAIPKVHFVFKSKAVVQKTLISAFEDDGSDENEDENQATSSEPSQFESSILSVFGEDRTEALHSSVALSGKTIPSTVVADSEKQVVDKEVSLRDCDIKEAKSKTVSLTDIEAFPVQVITSTRKEEVTPASSWPEFAVGKKEKGEEDEDRGGGSRSYDREDKSRKKSRRYSRERDERKKRSRYEGEDSKKINVRRKEDKRSDDEDGNSEYDNKIKIKKEKEDYVDRLSSGHGDRESSLQRGRHYDDDDGDGNRRRGRGAKDIDSYNKRRSRFDDEDDYRRGKGRDVKDEKYSRRRSGDDREDDYSRRKYDDDNRRVRGFERERSRDRSRERGRSRERERSTGKVSGKRGHRSRDTSHSRSRSRSPSRRRDRGRDRSRDRYNRDKSRSHSHERSMGLSSRRKNLKSFKEELLEELTKPSGKADPKDDLFKVAAINCTSQYNVFEYQTDPVNSSSADVNVYSLSHHGSEVAAAYHGQDPNLTAQYPQPYDHQQYGPQWHNQPAQNVYNQALPPQHQDIPNQYPSLPPDQTTAPHPYPFQPINSHYPQPSYSSSQALPDTYHPVPSIIHQHIPQKQHPPSGPQPPHFHMDQHGQIPPHYPNTQHQITPLYPPSGPQTHFQPPTFTQEPIPSFTSPDFHSHFGPRPKTPLLPNPVSVRTPLLRTPLIPHNIVETSNFGSPKFSSPEVVSSPTLQSQIEIRPSKKFKFGTLEEGTFSPVIKSSFATSSSPTVGSPSTSNLTTSEAVHVKPAVTDVSFALSSNPEPSFETSLLAESEFDSTGVHDSKKSSKTSISKKKNSLEVNEPTVSSSGVEDSTGDTGSDSGTDSSSQRPLKVKSRWRRNSEAEAVVDTSTPLPPMAKQILSRSSTSNDTPDSSPKERRLTRSRAAAEDCYTPQMTETPPPPPPPRKRIKIDPENVGMPEEQEAEVSRDSQEDDSKVPENEVRDLMSLMARPDFPKFEIITENIHLTERKRSKSMKRMLCDCTTSREERAKGLTACGSDCLNRMLMIECNSRCPCGEHCTNKRFQKKQYSHTAPFKAGDKGWGLIAEEDIEEKGTFIMEYVGELLDYEEFVRRTRQYSKSGLKHHYFMALNADEVVDATLKGSISRFINHSCDPNCETQKWTVNGELRVGFFTRKSIKKGEELTFDYQFEHYGEAQKCYCGAENCRGFIGLVKSPTRNNRRKEKKKKEIFKDELLEEDIAKLSLLDGMRNKNHVLDLCRLMVRAEKVQHRMAILKILQDTAETACLRLFLDYHGLSLLWVWMADIGTTDFSTHTQELKMLMLSVLKDLPITNKTALRESKIPDMVDRWAVAAVVAARKPPPPPPPASTTTNMLSVTTKAIDSVASRTALGDNEALAATETATQAEEAGSVEDDADKSSAAEPEATTSSESSPPASPSQNLPPLLSTITPVSILASAKDSKDAKRKRRVTFAEVPIESAFSPEPLGEVEENDDISSSTQSSGEKDGLEDVRSLNESGDSNGDEEQLSTSALPDEATASGDKRFGKGERKMKFVLKSDESLSGNVADSTSQKYGFDSGSSLGTSSDADNSDTETLIKDPLASLAAECVSLWSTLKEVFKIPKRERVEERKRTERELDVLSKKDLETSDPFAKWKRSKVMRLSKKKVLEEDERKPGAPKMSKEERRQLFEAQVKAEDELAAQAYAEEYQRQQEAYILHQQRLLEDPQYFYFHQQQGDPNFAGMDPSMIPPEGLTDPITGQPISSENLIDPHTGQPVIDPGTGQPAVDPNTGQPIIDQSTGRPLVLHSSQIDPNTGQPMVHTHHIDPQTGQPIHHLDPHTGQLIQHLDPITGQLLHQIDPITGQPIHQIDPITGQPIHQIDPITGQPIHQIDPITGQPIHQVDPITGQPIHQLDPITGQPLQIDPMTGQPHHIDQITGQSLHQLDPITGQPITSQIDPSTGQPIQHQMDQILTHPHIQSVHTHFDPHLGQPVQHPHPVHSKTAVSNFQQQPQTHLSGTTQSQSHLEIEFEEEVPPPPSPPTVAVTKLPPNWKTAKDSEGRVYYYHAFTRQTQWEMPSWDDNDDDSDDMDLDPNPVDEVIKAKKKTTTAAADTSSEVARKIKDQFRSKMSNFIVTYLNPYRKQDCKIGRIVSTDDFKHLARKLTHHVMSKELKHCRHVEDLEVNENVKAKAKDYVRKYMSKFGSTFKKSSSPHPDDSGL